MERYLIRVSLLLAHVGQRVYHCVVWTAYTRICSLLLSLIFEGGGIPLQVANAGQTWHHD